VKIFRKVGSEMELLYRQDWIQGKDTDTHRHRDLTENNTEVSEFTEK
jgi:hypothetical protein